MSRSVSTHRNAVATVYLYEITFADNDPDYIYDPDSEEGDGYFYFEFADFIEGLRNVVKERYPSFDNCDRWQDREEHVFLENGAAEVSVSEYCGLIAVCLAPRSSDYGDEPRNRNWTERIACNFEEHIQKRFPGHCCRKMGSFSNGEVVYERITPPGPEPRPTEGCHPPV